MSRDPYQEYLSDEGQQLFLNEDLQDAGKQLARYFMIKLGSASMAYPLEMTKILRQCQSVRPEPTVESLKPEEKPLLSPIRAAHESLSVSPTAYALPTDSTGYISLEEAPRASQWPIAIDKSKSLGSSSLFIARRQGLLSLWSGLVPFWIHRIGSDASRVVIEEFLEASQTVTDLIDTRVPVLYKKIDSRPGIIPIIAQAISGFLLSPLEVIYTRLAIQTPYKSERSYSGTIDAMRKVYRNEGGLSGFFPCPLVTLMLKTVSPILRILPSMWYSQYFEGFSEDASLLESLGLVAGQLGVLSIAPMVTLPLETVQRRLLIQSSDLITRVSTSQRRYRGAFDCFLSIIREEGVPALFQGLTMAFTSNLLMVAVDLATELEEDLVEDIEEF